MKSETIIKVRNRGLCQGLCLLLSITAVAQSGLAKTEILDKVAIIVNDDIVMSSELEERFAQFEVKLKQQGRPMPPREELNQALLDQMIVESLQLQLAKRAGVRIADAQLNESMTRIARQNGMELDAFRDTLTSEGLSYVATREQVRREMTIQQVQAGAIRGQVEITEQEVNNFLQSSEGQKIMAPQYHIAHILAPLGSGEPATAQRALVERAAKEIRSGTPLLQWLETYNATQPSPLPGGDLGWRKKDDLPDIFYRGRA